MPAIQRPSPDPVPLSARPRGFFLRSYRCRRAHRSGLIKRRAEGSRDFARLAGPRRRGDRADSKRCHARLHVMVRRAALRRLAMGVAPTKVRWGFARSHDVRIDLRIINRMRAGHRWWLLRRGRARRAGMVGQIRWRILHRPLPWIGRGSWAGRGFGSEVMARTQRAGHRFGLRRDRHAWRSSLSRSNLLLRQRGCVWRSLRDSNPCFRRERATSWAARRRERSARLTR